MIDTSKSLLRILQSRSDEAWQRFVAIYQPFVTQVLNQHGLTRQDAEDVAQESLRYVAEAIHEFEHVGRPGAFRNWLRSVTVNRLMEYRRTQYRNPAVNSAGGVLTEPVIDAASELQRIWDREHDQYVLGQLLKTLETEFETKTLLAFRRLMLDEQSPRAVADELAMTVAAVYAAKSRVMRKLRILADGLIDP